MTDTAGESSARAAGDTPASPASPEEEGSKAAPTGVRWGDDPPESPAGRDADATPPSGFAPPGPGEVVPARTSGTAPDPTPGAAWPNPAFQPGGWQQTTPGWAPGPPPTPPPDPARRRRVRRIVLAVVLGVLLLAAVVVALLAFVVGPRFARYDVLDRASVERGVTEVVTRDWKRQVGGVSCPDDQRVRPGTSFSCTGTVDGRPVSIPVDVTDASGTYEVGQPR